MTEQEGAQAGGAWTPAVGDFVRDTRFGVEGIIASEHEHDWGRYVSVYYLEIEDFVNYALPGYRGAALRYTVGQLECLGHDDYVGRCDWFVIRKAREALIEWTAAREGVGTASGGQTR